MPFPSSSKNNNSTFQKSAKPKQVQYHKKSEYILCLIVTLLFYI